MRGPATLITLIVALAACSPPAPPLSSDQLTRLEEPGRAIQVKVARLLPPAMQFLDKVETQALARGRTLTVAEEADARALGVRNFGRIRIQTVPHMPKPADPALASLGEISRVPVFTSGHGITLREGEENRWIVALALARVAQFQKIGREALVRRYLTETLVLPGTLIPTERAAIRAAEEVAGPMPGVMF